MPIVIQCSCGKQLRVGDELVGKKVRCPACKEVLAVEAPPVAAPSEPPALELEEDEPPRQRLQADRPSGKSSRRSTREEKDAPEQEEDEDERDRRPRSSRGKKAGKGGMSTGALVGIIIGAVVLVVGVCGGGIWAIVSSLSGGVDKVRGAATRVQSQNNLKQIGLSFHNAADVSAGKFPIDICDPTGKPLLSWRVAILPYIEQQGLHAQFRLNEPWDSPNNRPLAERMPKIYELPGKPGGNMTHYKLFTGPGAVYQGGNKPVRFPGDFPKGTVNTVLVVEAANPSIWSKPEDIPFDPAGDPLAQLEWTDGKCNVLLGDGSVRIIPRTLNSQEFKNAITRDGPAANTMGW